MKTPTPSAHFTLHADGTLTCRYGHTILDAEAAEHMHPEPNRNKQGPTVSLPANRADRAAVLALWREEGYDTSALCRHDREGD